MKKLLAILLVLLSLCGCGSKEKEVSIDIQSVTQTLLAEEQFKGIGAFSVEKLELKYSVDLSEMEEGVFYLPTDAEKANMFIIAKAKEGSEDILFDEIGMIVDKYYHSWTDLVYNAAEAAKVEKYTVKEIGRYYICVISENNEEVMNIILPQE